MAEAATAVGKSGGTSGGTPAAQIGLLIYPDCQLAAIHGLTDLFRIAGEWAALLAAEAAKEGAVPKPAPTLRVTHWRATEAAPGRKGGAEGRVECVWDSHPGAPDAPSPHRLTHVIAPPSLVMPAAMRPMPVSAAWMKARHAEGSVLGSVCAGAFVLAETGLVDGRRATTHWAFAETLAARFPAVRVADSAMVLDDGDLMTAGGILAWTDLGLTLVERLMGPSVMLATARFLLVDPPRRSQLPFAAFQPRFDHGDAAVLKAQRRLHADAVEGPGVAALAATAGLGERTFQRRFAKATGMRPVEYLQQVRIARAREALELTRDPVDAIAWAVGYADPAAFRKLFQRITGETPTAYRRRFGVV